jgi:hypothetical protein
MTPAERADVCALIVAARAAPRPDRFTQVLHFTRGLLAAGVSDPDAVAAQLLRAEIFPPVWVGAVQWSPAEVAARRETRQTARAHFVSRHGPEALRTR